MTGPSPGLAGGSTPPPTAPSLARRAHPHGARRRGIAPGLFIANPDNSDEDVPQPGSPSSQRSPVRGSPVTASSSGSGSRLPRVGSGGFNGDVQGHSPGIPIPSLAPGGSPRPGPMPTIPAPQSSPLPFISPMPSPQPVPPSLAMPASVQGSGAGPPMPPPQPERHMRRAQTTPVPDLPPKHESRPSLGSSPFRDLPPPSPSRALPPLPSPPIPLQRNISSPHSGGASPQPHSSHSSIANRPHTPSVPEANRRSPASFTNAPVRISSPEDITSPNQSDGQRSFGSMSSTDQNRARSGSVQGSKIRVQATIDNESFTTVDITGMQTAEGIKDRLFSKLRFRDDEYSNLSLFITDVDEQPDDHRLSNDALLHLCLTRGDAKANLKFFIRQDHFADSATATVVPPAMDHGYSNNADRRAGMPPLQTDLNDSQQSLHHEGPKSNSNSDWSEIHPEEAADYSSGSISRSKGMRQIANRRFDEPRSPHNPNAPSLSASSSTLPTPPRNASGQDIRVMSSTNSPTRYDQEIMETRFDRGKRKGSTTPIPSSSRALPPSGFGMPGSSSQGDGLGLSLDDGMDPETKALIAKLQEEEAQQTDARRRQLEADEEFARREQRAERDVWEMMQEMEMENARARTAQIEDDERRAREVEAEDRRQEEARLERAQEEAARTAWELEQREAAQSRDERHPSAFAEDRRQRAQHFQRQGRGAMEGNFFDNHSFPTAVPFGNRRTSDTHYDASRQHQYPTTNPIFDTAGGYSPSPPGSATYNPNPVRSSAHMDSRNDAPATGLRNSDPRFRQMSGRDQPGQRTFVGVGAGQPPPNRRDSRSTRPFAALNTDPDSLTAPALGNTRSMDNLRPFSPQLPVSRPPYEGVPPRTAITPGPGVTQARPYTPTDMYRSSSMERPQDGRYPDVGPRHRVTGSPSSPNNPYVTFPSPQTHARTGSASSLGYLGRGTTASPPPFGTRRSQEAHRPATSHVDFSPPSTSSTHIMAAGRPWTGYDGTPPRTESPDRSGSWAEWRANGVDANRSRSGSASQAGYTSLLPASPRRASHAGEDQRSGHALNESWLAVPHGRRVDTGDSETLSIAGTVSSQATTIRAERHNSGQGPDDEDSSNTAKVDDWTKIQHMLADSTGALRPLSQSDQDDDEEEATLFLPSSASNSLKPAKTIRQTLSRPNLSVKTDSVNGTRRGPFKYTGPEAMWHDRPDPADLFADLDGAFPDLDLDKPIVDPGLVTPTTPSSDSPGSVDVPLQPPPRHTSHSSPSPKADETYRHMPPPLHPARGDIVKNNFNKTEHRKSIRLMAEHKRRTLLREVKNVFTSDKDKDEKKDDEKPKRRLSMWGHRIQQVPPGKLQNDQVQPAIPESPAEDKPPVLRWGRGRLIGAGSYGRVYLGFNLATGDIMAVKQVDRDPNVGSDAADKRLQGQFDALKSEIALLKDLFHPNIVAYLGWEETPEVLSIFLEYVPGGTIAAIYRTPSMAGGFEEQLVRFFTEQILQGLKYLHERNVIHRDLKGDNILVSLNGTCKIVDFGISRKASNAYDSYIEERTKMKGSFFWMAPEMMNPPAGENAKSYSGKIDIWSLGCCVVEMFSGERPFRGKETAAVVIALFQGEMPTLPADIKISQPANDFLWQECLVARSEDRSTAAQCLRHPFITTIDPAWGFEKSKLGLYLEKKPPERAPSTVTPTPPPQASGSPSPALYAMG